MKLVEYSVIRSKETIKLKTDRSVEPLARLSVDITKASLEIRNEKLFAIVFVQDINDLQEGRRRDVRT